MSDAATCPLAARYSVHILSNSGTRIRLLAPLATTVCCSATGSNPAMPRQPSVCRPATQISAPSSSGACRPALFSSSSDSGRTAR
ncbi:MAG: hypothetical protein AW07_04496 [Candidatus Accumulibacter sp. SK-11]|nr:MAG: hypothetical protein AW07_04496 [Candidatus Accumulibacter sp. SK-11]